MIPQETVSRILDTARVEEVIGDFVTLKRRGGNLVACCPFHNEKTPSFYVSPAKGIYKCFGCGKAGSAVGFVMEYEHLSYVEALKYLARKYNIEVVEKELSPEEMAARQRTESLHLVCDFAEKFFVESLSTQEGHTIGYQYFKSRGLEDDTIVKYGLGWAPRSHRDFADAALKEGYKEEYLIDTGMCVKRDDGSLSDRFYDRVMFPFHTVSGRIVGFGGRTLKSDHTIAKYVNSPETEIYIKNRMLYGLYFAKAAISRLDKCYLVEGYLDVLSMHQLGITNVVASSGTSLTEGQIRLIKRFTSNVTIMYDGDGAGIKAALRGINMILKEGMNVKVVLLPDGDDPDSFSRKHTLAEVEDFIEANERDFIGFKTDLLLEEAGGDPLKKANLINDIADTIAEMPDAVKRSVYVDATADKFRIASDILFDRIRATREKALSDEEAAAARERARRDREASYAPEPVAEVPEYETVPPQVQVSSDEEPRLVPCERELLGFILTYGTSPLNFESDSEFYAGNEPQTVAEFIDDALHSDSAEFVNSRYRKVYNRYFELYDEGFEQDRIVKSLLDGEDREMAAVASELSQERYRLSVKNFSDALTSRESWLVNFVPRSILAYQDKKMEVRYSELVRKLASAPEAEQREIMADLETVGKIRRKIMLRLGREKKTH